jgi:hypothetical protein
LYIRTTISYVSTTFKQEGYEDPTLNRSGEKNIQYNRQINLYIKEDPKPKQRAALPIKVYEFIMKSTLDPVSIAKAELTTGALFYGMRSCEFVDVPAREQQKTRLVEIRDICFWNSRNEVINQKHRKLKRLATSMSITFREQKNGEKCETIAHEKSHAGLCPVEIFADRVSTIWKYNDTTENTTINTVKFMGRTIKLKSKDIEKPLKQAVRILGQDKLGIPEELVGRHSIRVTFATLMNINGASDTQIMLRGRWKSDSFRRCIRENVKQFGSTISRNVSKLTTGNFFTIRRI